MYEELLPGLYRVRLPLPGNPLKEINSYVILSKTRNLVIDTGLNRKECADALIEGFSGIGLDIKKTDLFLTHMHGDHIGLAGMFKTAGASIFCSEADSDLIRWPQSQWDGLKKSSQPHGFTAEENEAAIEAHPANKYRSVMLEAITAVKDGDCIEAGDYTLKCITTPGHTPGHICLYDPANKLLFAGDHILGDITPNISQWKVTDTFLANYLGSLDKIAELDVRLVLPGHRSMVEDCRARIKQLKEHHEHRNNEILAALRGSSKPLSAYQVAARISWNINKPYWVQYPVSQKWFATGETVAHLCYLRNKGEVKMIAGEHKVEWML